VNSNRASHAIFHVQLVQRDHILIVFHVTQLAYHNISIYKIINVPHNVILMNTKLVTHAFLVIFHVEHVMGNQVIIV